MYIVQIKLLFVTTIIFIVREFLLLRAVMKTVELDCEADSFAFSGEISSLHVHEVAETGLLEINRHFIALVLVNFHGWWCFLLLIVCRTFHGLDFGKFFVLLRPMNVKIKRVMTVKI